MQRIKARAKRLTLQIAFKNVFLIVFFLLIFDVSVVVLGASYLSQNSGAFLGKSAAVILSDILFLEGILIFTAGTFTSLIKSMQEPKPQPSQSTHNDADDEPNQEKRAQIGAQMIIIGAILIGLSITVGTLLR